MTTTPTGEQVIDAARTLAHRLAITPRWAERLTPEARALVEAVHAHDRGQEETT